MGHGGFQPCNLSRTNETRHHRSVAERIEDAPFHQSYTLRQLYHVLSTSFRKNRKDPGATCLVPSDFSRLTNAPRKWHEISTSRNKGLRLSKMPTLTSETHTNQFYNYKISNLPGRVTGIEVEITTAHVPLSGTLVENKPNHLQFTPKPGRPSPLLDKDSQGYGIIGCVATNGVPNAYRYLCMEPECRGTVFTRLHDLKRHHLDRHIPVRQGFWCLLSECDRSCGSAKPFKRQEDRDNHVLEVHGHLFNQSLKKPLDAAQHIPIPETAQELSLHNWKDLLPTMPEDISDNLELGESPGAGLVWSCTPSNGVSCNDIPLTILDRPVVIPVEHHSLASAYTMPPPDPHRHRFVDASKAIDEDTVNQVFNTYEGILGFYLLINGMLQLIVPDDFDHEYALSHRPNEFGGLRVSYIAQSMTPTADVAVAEPLVQSEDSSVTASVHSQKADISRTPTLSPQSTTMSSTAGSLEIGSTVQAVVEGSKMRDRYQAKIGLMTMSKGQHFLVVPSHMLTQALGASKTKAFPGNNWKDAVTVRACNGDQKVHGKIFSV